MADQRLIAVYGAASSLFIKRGYANSQVSQIAAEANIATGTIYNLFASKKSILHFVLLSTFDRKYLGGNITLPVKEVDTELIIQHLSLVIEDLFSKIEESVQSFSDMLSVLFDSIASYHVAFSIINDNKSALDEIESKYRTYVNNLYKLIEKNLQNYIEQGEVRKVELPRLHIRNILEGITWWAMYLPYQDSGKKIPVSQSKDIALDILKHAYMKKMN
ncbi:TetR family transcriptional regulator [Mycoplasmatota bacterium zrk1]